MAQPVDSVVPAAAPPTRAAYYVVCRSHGNITADAMNLWPHTDRMICPHCLCDWLCKAFPVIVKQCDGGAA